MKLLLNMPCERTNTVPRAIENVGRCWMLFNEYLDLWKIYVYDCTRPYKQALDVYRKP